MLTVATVLKSGGEYRGEHVRALRGGVAANLTIPHRFVCLSDLDGLGCETIPLRHGWPGWWSKIELFAPGALTGPVLYLDLDTVVVGNLDRIALGHRWTVLQSFWTAKDPARIGSGLMAWSIDLSSIYHAFAADPYRFMAEGVTRENWGDQGFILNHWPEVAKRWQHIHPGRVVSWKLGCRGGVPATAAIVCFHGQPRPWRTSIWKAAA